MINFAQTFSVTNAGGTVTLVPELVPSSIYLEMDSTRTILAGNYAIEYSALPEVGASWKVVVDNRLELNGNTFTVFGIAYTADMEAASTKWVYTFDVVDISGTPTLIVSISPIRLTSDDILQGTILIDGTEPLAKLVSGTSAQMIVCNGSGVPTYVSVTGDVTTSNAGVTAIGAGKITNSMVNASAAIAVTKLAAMTATKLVTTDASGFITTAGSAVIVNADINAAAAIALSKLAALTASKVAVTDGSGVITTANQLSALLGGTSLDTSASTGVPIVTAGTWSVGARTEVALLQVSFESGYLGDFKITMPFAGTVTGIYAYATKAIAGTDNGTIQMKNNAGTSTTNGLITYTAADARGTSYSVVPTANNTFAANDILTFTTAKTTAGGVVQLSITYTRLT